MQLLWKCEERKLPLGGGASGCGREDEPVVVRRLALKLPPISIPSRRVMWNARAPPPTMLDGRAR